MKRVVAWWLLAEHVCARVSGPRIDVTAADRDIEALLRGSWIGSVGESFASRIQAAWTDSRCRHLLYAAANRRL